MIRVRETFMPFYFDDDAFSRTLKSNVVSPALTAQAYLPYLEKRRKKVTNISSGLSNIASALGRQLAT
jgi:NAD(P)-dependent dehydrogenase (short-subunit alcohol dehydrogenase family)